MKVLNAWLVEKEKNPDTFLKISSFRVLRCLKRSDYKLQSLLAAQFRNFGAAENPETTNYNFCSSAI